MFPGLTMSPNALWLLNKPTLFFNCIGSMRKTHIDIGVTSGLSTLIQGKKIIVSWPSIAKNLKLFEPYHHVESSWDAVFLTMKKLKEPHVNLLLPGHLLYLPVGQLHGLLSPKAGVMYGLDTVNPTKDVGTKPMFSLFVAQT